MSLSLSHPVFYRATRRPQLSFRWLSLLPFWIQNRLHHIGVADLVTITAYALGINPKVSVEEMIRVARLHGYRNCPRWAIEELKAQAQLKLFGILFAPIGPEKSVRLRVNDDHKVVVDPNTEPPTRFSLIMLHPKS